MKITNQYMTEEQIKESVKRFRYVRNEEHEPIGVVLIDKNGLYGWSLYNQEHEDEQASTDKGLLIALSRAATVEDFKDDVRTRVTEAAGYGDVTRLTAVFAALYILKRDEALVPETGQR